MTKHVLRFAVATAALTLAMIGVASARPDVPAQAVAQATPGPAATSTPNPLTVGGYVRSYYFTRTNNPQFTTKNPLNQATWNTGVSLDAAYALHGGFSVGGSYLFADPLTGSCSTAASHAAGAPCVRKNTGALLQGTNPDDTLPGFRMNALYEAYLQFKNASWFARLGDQVINTPWANASDSRLKPVAFQAADVRYAFDKHVTGEAIFANRFEGRANSAFSKATLLTATKIADAPGAASNLHLPAWSSVSTGGFGYARLSYANASLDANLHLYAFSNIANALWLDGKYTWKTAPKPFVAIQAGTERNAGSAVVGEIDSQVFGIQGGISPWKNVEFTAGYDVIPEKSDTLTLPAGVTCSASGAIGGTAPFMYFLPSGGTPQCRNNPGGTTTVYYGGWASPYTDSYATDPLFATTISQGMVDRRSAGQGLKLAAAVALFEKRIRLVTARAWYRYGNAAAGVAPTQEFDLDGTYFFSKVGPGPYRGFSLRHRYAERTQPFFTSNKDFKYNRTQLEYDF